VKSKSEDKDKSNKQAEKHLVSQITVSTYTNTFSNTQKTPEEEPTNLPPENITNNSDNILQKSLLELPEPIAIPMPQSSSFSPRETKAEDTPLPSLSPHSVPALQTYSSPTPSFKISLETPPHLPSPIKKQSNPYVSFIKHHTEDIK
jgi:hypothetical protein